MTMSEISSLLPTSLGKQMQLGFIVRDLDEALRVFTEDFKVGPFIIIEEALGDRRFVHRGKESPLQMSLALSYHGSTQIEFITQTNDAPSPYTEFLAEGREGLHHIAFYPDDYEQACKDLVAAGFEEVCYVQMPDGSKNVSYFNSPPQIGVMIELVPLTPLRRQHYAGIKLLSESWDGQNPVRRFKTRPEFIAAVEESLRTATV